MGIKEKAVTKKAKKVGEERQIGVTLTNHGQTAFRLLESVCSHNGLS